MVGSAQNSVRPENRSALIIFATGLVSAPLADDQVPIWAGGSSGYARPGQRGTTVRNRGE